MNKALIMGIAALLAVAAFSGIIMPAKAADQVVAPNDTGSWAAYVAVNSAPDGVNFCSGPGETTATAVPYGNVTFYEAAEVPMDPAKTPEEYLGWVAGDANGMASDGGYYILVDAGAKMADWWPTGVRYYVVIDIVPTAYGGHHPTATRNYTAYDSVAQWDGVNFWWPHVTSFNTLAVAQSGADAVLTWTQLPQSNSTLSGYAIYRSIGGAAWTKIQNNVGLVGTYTVVGGWAAGTRYTMAPVFAENFHIKGRSNIVACAAVANNPPVSNAGPDQIVNEDTVVTFDGSASTDSDGSIVSYSWTFTDGVLRTLTGVSPTYTFATPGVYTVTLQVTDDDGATDATPDTMTVTVNDNTAIAINDLTPGSVAPATAFQISCQASDYQNLNINSVQLYWEDILGVVTGPVVADVYLSVGDNQITKADEGNELKDTHTYTWNIPAQANPGEVQYYFATNDGVTGARTYPVGADLVAGPYEVVLIQVQGNQNQPHPLVGRVYDNATGVLLDGAIVTATWYDSTEGLYFTNWTVSAPDGLGVSGWYQIDIFHNNWTIGDLLWVNATYTLAGVPYYGYNTTLFASGDDFLPDDDKEYINVYIDVVEFFEVKWTMGWNIWSHPMIRSENVSLGLTDLPFSWFANEHWLDTSQVGVGDDATLVAWTGAAYVTWIHGVDANGSATDITVQPDYGYWAEVSESWFTDEAALALPELGILVPGQYPFRYDQSGLNLHPNFRTVPVIAGWNLLGWTSLDSTYTANTVRALFACPAGFMGIAQPEILANWTAADWEDGNTADMQHFEDLPGTADVGKGYTTYVFLGGYGQSTINHDFPIGPGYGFWVYSETAGSLTYQTD